jgi:hypothetical protein
MKWLKGLFKPQDFSGVAPSKPLSSPSAPKTEAKISAVDNSAQTPSAPKAHKPITAMNEKERIALYASLKTIPKPTTEFPTNPQLMLRKQIPEGVLEHLNIMQRKLISVTQDYGFMIWKSQNPKKTTISNGEIIALSASETGLKADYDLAVQMGDYQAFPFSDYLQNELRAKVLNTISSNDTEEKLLKEFFELLPQFTSPQDAKIMKALIEQAQKELPKRTFLFTGALNGKETAFDEVRSDSLDLLALKELVLAMDDKPLAPLNLATGFFTKLTEFSDSVKELMEPGQDFAGIILKVEKNFLKEIRVAQAPRVGKVGVHGPEVKNGLSRYSPLLASVAMYLTYFLKVAVSKPDDGKAYINDDTVDIVDAYFEKGKSKFYSPDTRYYAIVDGCVAGPNDFRYYGHEFLIANNTRIHSGEVFMFHSVEGKPRGTKIAFTPRDYGQVHPLLRTGGLIYGDQDMSYQSVPWFPGDIAEDVVNEYKDWWKKKVDSGEDSFGDAYSPALVMARNLYFQKDENGNPTSQTDIFKTGNYLALGLALSSISGETDFTDDWWMENISFIHMFYSMDISDEIKDNFYSHICTLNRHWNLKTYLHDGLGVTYEKQPTLVQNLCQKMRDGAITKKLAFVLELYSGDTESSKVFRKRFHKKVS